jgi:hypothetical protein
MDITEPQPQNSVRDVPLSQEQGRVTNIEPYSKSGLDSETDSETDSDTETETETETETDIKSTDPTVIPRRVSNGAKKHECPYNGCIFTTTHTGRVNSHYLNAHTGKNTHPFKCVTCNAVQTTQGNLNSHMKTHVPVDPNKCPTCEQLFTTRHSYLSHMRSHSKVKPWPCKHCSLECANNCILLAHMRKTHKSKLFICSVQSHDGCDGYISQQSLHRHELDRHNEQMVNMLLHPILPGDLGDRYDSINKPLRLPNKRLKCQAIDAPMSTPPSDVGEVGDSSTPPPYLATIVGETTYASIYTRNEMTSFAMTRNSSTRIPHLATIVDEATYANNYTHKERMSPTTNMNVNMDSEPTHVRPKHTSQSPSTENNEHDVTIKCESVSPKELQPTTKPSSTEENIAEENITEENINH